MATEINKYHTSKIYKISSPQCEKFYIGSTTNTINIRLSEHKSNYKRYIKNEIGGYLTSFEVVKFDDCIIELIKDVKCENRKELERVEGDCIKEHHDRILNKYVAGRTDIEYYEANKINLTKYKKEYYEANKDKNKEIIKEYREANKDKYKEYCEANKEKIKEQKKEYHKAHKEHLNNKRKERNEANKEKFNCDCSGKYTTDNKTKHEKTKKHQLFISNQS
jgi:hypothetical protein